MIELKNKISTLAVTATSASIFVGVVLLAPLMQSASGLQQIGSVLFTSLTSLGLYKLVFSALSWLFRKYQWIRKLLLGDAFLEGTWVGHWKRNGKHVFTIETINQNDGETRITGRQIGENGETQADWSSEIAFIDLRRERLTYVYSCDVYRTKHQQNGIGVFKMIKPSKKLAPNMLDGYAVDMVDGDKDPNREHKISDDIVSTEHALSEAKRVFNL